MDIQLQIQMSMRRLVILTVLVVGFIAGLGWACCLFYYDQRDKAEFVVKVTLSVGTISAVACALFGDFLRNLCDPIRVKIDLAARANNFLDDHGGKKVFCHHLTVVNGTPERAITNCRVWLKSVSVKSLDGKWDDKPRFAVPRLMEWAPSEYSRDKRTFSRDQVFDLGVTASNNGGFRLTVDRDQGGNFDRNFAVGQQLKLVFFVTADNYTRSEEFCFEVAIPKSEGGADTVTPSIVTLLESQT